MGSLPAPSVTARGGLHRGLCPGGCSGLCSPTAKAFRKPPPSQTQNTRTGPQTGAWPRARQVSEPPAGGTVRHRDRGPACSQGQGRLWTPRRGLRPGLWQEPGCEAWSWGLAPCTARASSSLGVLGVWEGTQCPPPRPCPAPTGTYLLRSRPGPGSSEAAGPSALRFLEERKRVLARTAG